MFINVREEEADAGNLCVLFVANRAQPPIIV